MVERDFDVVYPEETVQELEAGLGVTFSSKVYTERRAIGELFDDVWNEVMPLARAGGRCPTAASFHLVKRAIQEQCPREVITPATVLTDLEGFEYIKLQAALRRNRWKTPFRAPRTETGAWIDAWLPHILLFVATWVGCWTALGAGPRTAVSGGIGVMAGIAILAVGIWLRDMCLFRQGLPGAETAGALAHSVARMNLKRLRADGATGLNRTIVWRLLFGREPVDRSPVFIWDF